MNIHLPVVLFPTMYLKMMHMSVCNSQQATASRKTAVLPKCKNNCFLTANAVRKQSYYDVIVFSYIMPPIPGLGIAGIAGASSFLSAMTHSVVRNIPAMLAAFSRATRVTLAGSITPVAKKFS